MVDVYGDNRAQALEDLKEAYSAEGRFNGNR